VEAAKKAIMNPDIDFIQVPCNAWDQRMVDGGVFELAQQNNKLGFIRSVFLQGVLLMTIDEIKEKLLEAYDVALSWDFAVSQNQCKKEEYAIWHVDTLKCPLILGVESNAQMLKNVNFFHLDYHQNKYKAFKTYFSNRLNKRVVDPFRWDK
jgi:hypothetical protein